MKFFYKIHRSKSVIIIFLLLILLLNSGASKENISSESSHTTSSPYEFKLTAIEGDTTIIRHSDLRGKVVLVNFWATWCPFCIKEIPELIKIRNKYKKSELEIIGIALPRGNSRRQLLAFKNKYFKETNNKINYTIVIDEGIVARKYSVRGIPANFLFDREGNLVAKPGLNELAQTVQNAVREAK